MESLRRFRLMTVRLSIFLTLVAAIIAYPLDLVVAKGIMAGGLGGIIAFWAHAYRMERLAIQGEMRLNGFVIRWTILRMALYAVVLGWAYSLDEEALHGILSAAGGLFIVRIVQVLLGITGWDLNPRKDADGAHR